MGKDKARVREAGFGRERVIPRAKFVAAIDRGIERAGGVEALAPFVDVNELNRIKHEATEMDANTWKCAGSCGCPMALLGAVEILPRGDNSQTTKDAGGPVAMFASGYDRAVGVTGATTLRIQD